MPSKPMSTMLLALVVAIGVACGAAEPPQPAPLPQQPVGTDTGASNSPGNTQPSTRSCPSECPDDCDAFSQCNYEIDGEARYRVELNEASLTAQGSRACSLTSVILGFGEEQCDLYVVFRTLMREYRSAVSRQSSIVFGGLTIPDITVNELQTSFEVHLMNEEYNGDDVTIAICRPDLTREALEFESLTIQCGVVPGLSNDPYGSGGTSKGRVTIYLVPLDGGAIKRRDSSTTDTTSNGSGY